jgi:hypothetical protein
LSSYRATLAFCRLGHSSPLIVLEGANARNLPCHAQATLLFRAWAFLWTETLAKEGKGSVSGSQKTAPLPGPVR